MSDTTFTISIPSDNDGYCLMQCPTCGEYFKITPGDYEDDGVLEIRCPTCGLAGDTYITEDVMELAMAKAQNYANDLVYNELKKMERPFKGGFVSIKVSEKPKPEFENPIYAGIEALSITHFPCCNRKAKIKPLMQITGCYCPFCGVINYEIE